MNKTAILFLGLLLGRPAEGQIRRDPNGVNVASSGATTVFITFGGLRGQVPAEAFWCGELLPATPDLGFKCDPATLFGRLPLRYDQSLLAGSSFTDVMSIPPSVARRAYQAAAGGARSSFFYVRRFVSLAGGPDEYVFVTCRLAGGGARVPFSLLDVALAYSTGETVLALQPGERPPGVTAVLSYNGTGRLKGRWEVVLPGDELPESRDLLTEASLPLTERGRQRRYAPLQRFNVFLPPTGRYVLPGPDAARLPTLAPGLHLVLLRIEASDDKEGDSNLALAGAGTDIAHSGAVAGFPMPVLRYYVGAAGPLRPLASGATFGLLLPFEGDLAATPTVDFAWSEGVSGAALYRLEVEAEGPEPLLQALVSPGTGTYRTPPWWRARAGGRPLRWRVVALGPLGETLAEAPWRGLRLQP